jgi:hypothetical protein
VEDVAQRPANDLGETRRQKQEECAMQLGKGAGISGDNGQTLHLEIYWSH